MRSPTVVGRTQAKEWAKKMGTFPGVQDSILKKVARNQGNEAVR